MNKLEQGVLQTLKPALWIGASAAGTFVLTALLKRPDLTPYYGILNILLVFLNEARKAE